MSKYTKGKWRGGRECINDEQGRLLAMVCYRAVVGERSIPNEEGYANSYMMAAAPEMYEALKELHHHLDRIYEITTSPNIKTIIKDMDETLYPLLAKAEGKEE